MAAAPDPVSEWTDYWRETATDACTAAFPAAVTAAIAGQWRALLGTLPKGASLIDIGCGRGAVLALARDAGCAVTGVDLARLDSADLAIQGGIDAARLPFGDDSFDVAVSQFGVEYAGLLAAGLEAARVAKRHIWCLFHAAEGPVVASAAEVVAQSAWLGSRLCPMVTGNSPTIAYTAANLEKLRADILLAAETAANTSLLEATWQALQAPDPAALAWLLRDMAAWAARLQLLSRAAPNGAAVAALGAVLTARGWAVSIHDEGLPPAGRWLLAERIGA